MNNYVATFEKIPFEQFIMDAKDTWLLYSNEHCEIAVGEEEKIRETLTKIWNEIKLPRRSTVGSAGYDFYLPFSITLARGSSVLIPTGICCNFHCEKAEEDNDERIYNNYSLDIYPRSGLGFRHQCRLVNTIGIIDEDYYYSKNHGHIMIKMSYEGISSVPTSQRRGVSLLQIPPDTLILNEGERFAQGIIHKFYTATNDDDTLLNATRVGGFGSTGL